MGKKVSLVLICLLASVLLISCGDSQSKERPPGTSLADVLFPTKAATAAPSFSSSTPVGTGVTVSTVPPTTLSPTSTSTKPSATTTPTEPSTPTNTPTPTSPPSSTPTDTSIPPTQDPDCLDAAYIADITIPDGTLLDPGQAFVKTWRVVNDGTCSWPAGAQLAFDSGNSLGAPAGVSVGVLEVEQTTDISVNMTAPTVDGPYHGSWKFLDSSGQSFGTDLTVVIRVGSPTPTSPPSPTGAPTQEPSPTSPQPSATPGTPGAPSPTSSPPSPTPTSPPPASPTSTPPPPPTATTAPPPNPQPTNLRNGNFEADWSEESSHRCLTLPEGGSPYELQVGNVFTPPGWVCWFRHQEGVWAQPEGRDAWARNPDRMRGGAKGYVLFTFHKAHDAGLYQQVNVAPGTNLRFSAWVHAWSNHADLQRPNDFPHPDDPNWSDGAGYEKVAWPEGSQPPIGDAQHDARTNFTFWVGIDPTGGTNPLSGSVVWSQGWHIYNGYVQELSVQTVAQSGTVTVFVRSRTKWPFKHNDAYWDDARLDQIN